GVTGSTRLVDDGSLPAATVRSATPPRPAAPRRNLFDDPAPAVSSHEVPTRFDVEQTVVGVLRAHADPTATFVLTGAFGTITVAARAVWIDLAPGGAANLAMPHQTMLGAVEHVDPQRVDRTGSRDLEGALWDLTVAVCAGRLPNDLPA